MLGLPAKAEVSKMLPKKVIYEKFKMNTAQKAKFDADISRISIVGEISPTTIQIPSGKTVSSFYILQIVLKNKKYDEKVIASMQKLIHQRMIFLLQYEAECCLAYYQNHLYYTEWTSIERLSISLAGMDLDTVWTSAVKGIVWNEELGEWNNELTLNENLASIEEYIRVKKEIEKLEAQARKEVQPKKKMELFEKIQVLQKGLK